MKLYATITNSHGKREGKGDDNYLEILLNEKNDNRFLIAYDGKQIQILNYGNGERTTIPYAEQARKTWNEDDIKAKQQKADCIDCYNSGWCDAHAREAGE